MTDSSDRRRLWNRAKYYESVTESYKCCSDLLAIVRYGMLLTKQAAVLIERWRLIPTLRLTTQHHGNLEKPHWNAKASTFIMLCMRCTIRPRTDLSRDAWRVFISSLDSRWLRTLCYLTIIRRRNARFLIYGNSLPVSNALFSSWDYKIVESRKNETFNGYSSAIRALVTWGKKLTLRQISWRVSRRHFRWFEL